jgi:hypothetical protein
MWPTARNFVELSVRLLQKIPAPPHFRSTDDPNFLLIPLDASAAGRRHKEIHTVSPNHKWRTVLAKPYKPKGKRRAPRKVVPAPQPRAPKRDWWALLIPALSQIIAALIARL